MTATGFHHTIDGPVATVTLDRPEVRNAQTPQMWAGLREVARSLPGDVRVVVVRGAGASFSAGLDLATLQDAEVVRLAQLPPEAAEQRIAEFQQAFTWLRRPDLISIAAVHGHAIGAGFQLALACDMRIVGEDTQFAMAEVKLGLVPDLTGTKRLVELVGYGRALELCVTGRRVGAAEAARIGLANLVVPGAELESATADLVGAVLAGDRNAVVEIKSLIAGASGRDAAAQELAERQAQVRRLRELAGLGE